MQTGFPPLVFPQNMRRHTYSLGQVFWQNVALYRKKFLLLAVIFVVYVAFLQVISYGWQFWRYPGLLLNVFLIAGGALLFVLLAWSLLYWRRLKADKLMYVEQAFAFDEQALYCVTPYSQSRTCWNLFTAWAELEDAFVVRTSRGGWILPKIIWTVAEVDHLRTCLHERIRR